MHESVRGRAGCEMHTLARVGVADVEACQGSWEKQEQEKKREA